MSVFLDRDLPGRLNYVFRPWTRDTGATVAQPRYLYPIAEEGNVIWAKNRLRDLSK